MSTAASASRWKIILAFGLVYVFWGSTYLGIGIAVEQIPPALMCATRFLIAGTIMLAYCALTGRRIRFSARQLGHLAAVGILLLMGGNLTLSYAEQIVPTGLAALLIAVTPLWFLVLDSLLLGDHHISRRGKIGLAIGIAGVVVLIWPDLLHTQLPRPARTLVVAGIATRIVQLGARLGAVEEVADRGGRSLQRDRLAGTLCGNREPDFRATVRDLPP